MSSNQAKNLIIVLQNKICICVFLLTISILIVPSISFSQGIGISDVSITPDASSILELKSTTKGFLIPRMTTAQRTTLAGTAVVGLMVYDTDTKLIVY